MEAAGAIAVALVMGLSGCADALSVDLQTDLSPGREFDRIVVAVDGEERLDRRASSSMDYVDDYRLLETPLAAGEHAVDVTLWQTDYEVTTRRVRVHIDGPTDVTVVLSRSCANGVWCDLPDASQCFGGTCVPEVCTPENPLACPPRECTPENSLACPLPTCTADSDCAPTVGCLVPRCVHGTCLEPVDDSLCADGTSCHPAYGCAGRAHGAAPTVTSVIPLAPEAGNVARDVAVHPGGGFAVIGSARGFVARYDSGGSLMWSRSVPEGEEAGPTSVTVDAAGAIYTSGAASGDLRIADVATSSAGSEPEGYLASWTATGEPRWASRLDGASTLAEVRVDDAGTLFAAGTEGAYSSAEAGHDILLAYASGLDGAISHTRSFAGLGNEFGNAVIPNGHRGVTLAASSYWPVDFGRGPILTEPSGGSAIVEFSPDGDVTEEWVLNSPELSIAALARTTSGRLLVIGTAYADIELRGTTEDHRSRTWVAFIASVDVEGAVEWIHRFGSPPNRQTFFPGYASAIGKDVTVDVRGNAYVVGTFEVAVEVAEDTVLLAEGEDDACDMFIASLDPEGKLRWARALGPVRPQSPAAIARDTEGVLYVAGGIGTVSPIGLNGAVVPLGATAIVIRFDESS